MLINTKIGTYPLNKFMQLLVTEKLTLDHFKLPNNDFNVELINIHIPNINKTKFVHILYYLILYPSYLSLVTEFCKHNIIKINECTIQPDNIIDPINYCNNVYISVLSKYGFDCNLEVTENKFIEGILTYSTIQELIKNKIIIPEIFFSKIDYNNYLNHMILSIMAAAKSMTEDKQKIIIEQYMIGLAVLFKYSNNIFTSQHMNKILTCKNKIVVLRILRYSNLNPTKFNINPNYLCIDNDLVTEDIKNIIIENFNLNKFN